MISRTVPKGWVLHRSAYRRRPVGAGLSRLQMSIPKLGTGGYCTNECLCNSPPDIAFLWIFVLHKGIA
jgi:hypothetical protein